MKYLAVFAALIVLVIVGYSMLGRDTTSAPRAPSDNRYESAIHGIAFFYPDGFVITEQEIGTSERSRYMITIVREEDVGIPEGGEGPTAVTIDIHDNALDQTPLYDWMTASSFSNYKLGPMTYATTSVDRKESVTYRWSGLYEGETTAFLHEDRVFAVSGTFMEPTDPVVLAYRMILGTMAFRQ